MTDTLIPAIETSAKARVDLYNRTFPDRPPLVFGNGWITGTWCIGACYKNPNKLYGAYPYGYLDRVFSMFPDADSVLHVFSGGLTKEAAYEVAAESTMRNVSLPIEIAGPETLELVDMKGPEDGRFPTWQGDVTNLPAEWVGRFDLILADPPYSSDDCLKYGTPMPNIAKVMRELHRVAKPGASLVWLDQKWPMHRKLDWQTYGHIGLVRSTNHRMRLVSLFKAV